MLIPLPFHGQSPPEDVEAVLTDPSVLAATNKYPLAWNPNLFESESFETFSAPLEFQRVWMAHREPRFARSCIVCPMWQNQGSLSPTLELSSVLVFRGVCQQMCARE